jgi:protein-tyrosine phosphatase
MNHIYKNIFVGNSQDPKNTDELLSNNIAYILNVAQDLDVNPLVGKYYKCGLMDGPGNTFEDYSRIMLIALSLFLEGKNILIHCHEGKSRSAFIAMVLISLDIIRTQTRKSSDVKQEALGILVKARPIVTINRAHLEFHDALVASFYSRL